MFGIHRKTTLPEGWKLNTSSSAKWIRILVWCSDSGSQSKSSKLRSEWHLLQDSTWTESLTSQKYTQSTVGQQMRQHVFYLLLLTCSDQMTTFFLIHLVHFSRMSAEGGRLYLSVWWIRKYDRRWIWPNQRHHYGNNEQLGQHISQGWHNDEMSIKLIGGDKML